VRTYLPRSAFDGERQYSIGSGGVLTQRFLQRFLPGQRISLACVRVEFRQRGSRVVVKVMQEPMLQPKLWWIGTESRATSELRFDARGLVSETFVAVARAIRGSDGGHQVCLAADVDGTTQVSVPRAIAKGTLGHAVVLNSDPLRDVAVLAMNASIANGSVVAATPIQQLASAAGQGNLPKELWSAPILVVQ
jgi:hypothetical protein